MIRVAEGDVGVAKFASYIFVVESFGHEVGDFGEVGVGHGKFTYFVGIFGGDHFVEELFVFGGGRFGDFAVFEP